MAVPQLLKSMHRNATSTENYEIMNEIDEQNYAKILSCIDPTLAELLKYKADTPSNGKSVPTEDEATSSDVQSPSSVVRETPLSTSQKVPETEPGKCTEQETTTNIKFEHRIWHKNLPVTVRQSYVEDLVRIWVFYGMEKLSILILEVKAILNDDIECFWEKWYREDEVYASWFPLPSTDNAL
ncbi:hypothetical protein BDV96DRAFT_646621 [Lophiotrema nucula]|uniref:Uncharacterized protein n=1 Tax=Lophiotrema nucula TaxID=690887 RepID=A0A6A5Z6R5_9PLEO|nr:hypothetical protein BDV96DRAFT_646621 [Lophiotrema nucula]